MQRSSIEGAEAHLLSIRRFDSTVVVSMNQIENQRSKYHQRYSHEVGEHGGSREVFVPTGNTQTQHMNGFV